VLSCAPFYRIIVDNKTILKYCSALWTIFLTFGPITINNKNILSLSVTETEGNISYSRYRPNGRLYYMAEKRGTKNVFRILPHLVDINVKRHDNALTYSISDWSKGHVYNIYIYIIIRHYFFLYLLLFFSSSWKLWNTVQLQKLFFSALSFQYFSLKYSIKIFLVR